MLDVVAREMTPQLLRIAAKARSSLTSEQKIDLDFVKNLMESWDFNMDKDSVPASVYMHAQRIMYSSLFANFSEDVLERNKFTGNYAFTDFYRRLMDDIEQNGSESRFEKFCAGAYPSETYSGSHCAYIVARSFTESRQFLLNNVGPNVE